MTTKTIARETDGTAKGFTLQKLRAASLVLQHFQEDEPSDFLAAVEYGGDIYLDGLKDRDLYIEENKHYGSKDFSFASPEILNTLVYFLDYWFNNGKDPRIKFGFYATNGILDERSAGRAKALSITYPDLPILEILKKGDFHYPNLLPAVQALTLEEYKDQYTGKRKVALSASHYNEIIAMTEADWRTFLSKMQWQFNQPGIEELEDKLLHQIRTAKNVGSIIPGHERYIRAELFYQLETRHAKQKPVERFLDKNEVELVFLRIAQGVIDYKSLKFLNLDYTDLRIKTSTWLTGYIQQKYSVITGRSTPPNLHRRQVSLLDPVRRSRARQTEAQPDDTLQLRLTLSDQIPFDRPIFLYGELGSGKSTHAADYVRDVTARQPGLLPIFVPSFYLKGKSLHTIEDFTAAIDRYVNEELAFPDKIFRLEHAMRIPKDVIIAVDGVDELNRAEAQDLLRTLKLLKDHHSSLRILATGRPLELESLLSPDWLAYTMVPLTVGDIQAIFLSEARSAGLSVRDAAGDATRKMALLKARPDLLSVTTTPLVACGLFPELDDTTPTKTLGDIVYSIFKRRLDWHLQDGKHYDYSAFLTAYPSNANRQRLIAPLALDIYLSISKSLHETTLHDRLEELVPNGVDKAKIVTEAFHYFEQTLLQKTTNGHFSFNSQPMLECATGVALADMLTRQATAPGPSSPSTAISLAYWRPLSFAMTAIRERGTQDTVRPRLQALFQQEVVWPYTNIAQAAIVAAELNEAALASELIRKIKTLAFRPLREISVEDHLSASSFAACIKQSGDPGFNWLLEEYLDGRRPLNNFEDSVVAKVLGYLILQGNYQLPTGWQILLNDLAQLNKHFVTSFCHKGLSILALLPAIRLSVGERALLLAELLNDDLFGMAAESALRTLQLEPGATHTILNALETVSSRTHFSQTIKTSMLWFEYYDGRPLSRSIIRNCLSAATKEHFPDIFSRLTTIISEPNLRSYLRYLVLSDDEKSAADAALFLLWAGDTDAELLIPALSRAIDWLTHRYEATDDIIAFLKAQPRDLAIYLTAAMPTDNHLGIQPSFWHLYIQSLRRSPLLHHRGFSRLVDGMSLHLLTRYPAIKMDMIDLLNNQGEYKELLLDWGNGLDLRRAFHANAILTACYPRMSPEPLITLVKGSFSNGSDQDEWERFLLGLDFSDNVKQDLLSQLPVLVERSKIFALSILYSQGWPLSEAQINELATGLLSRSYSFDSLFVSQENGVKLLSEPPMKTFLISKSTDSNKQIAERAANLLLTFHKDGLTEEQRDSLYGLDGVSSDFSFYHLLTHEPGLLDSVSFRTSVENNGSTPPSLFYLFFKALDNAAEWEAFFQRAINQGGRFIQHDYAHLFNWIVSFLRLRPAHRAVMAAAMNRLLDIPGYKEHSSIYGSLLVFAYELGTDVTVRVQDHVDDWYSDVDEETNLAISVRSGIDVSLVPKGSNGTHYVLFAHHQPDGLQAISAAEIDKLIADTPYLSEKLIPGIGQALLFGQFSPEERKTIAQKSSAGVVWDTVIGYCRGEQFSIERLLFTIEKDFFDRKNGHSEPVYVSMIEKIAYYTAQKAVSHPAYVAALRSLLTTEDHFYYRSFIIKLFEAGEQPTIAEVSKLVRFVLDWDGAIDAQMAWYLSRYFSGTFLPSEASDLVQAIEPVLGAITLHYRDRRHHSYLLPCWVLSLALIRLSGTVSPTAIRAFLLGFQTIFVANDSPYMDRFGETGKMAFPGRDLLNTTWDLFDVIPDSALRQLYSAGAKSNIPEVRTISRMLNALDGNRSRE